MSEEMNKESESKRFRFNQEEVVVPDLSEVWKELYYSTEKAWGDAFKDFISTDTFVNMLDKTLEQYLAYEKMSRESIDKYCEMNPMASKKDIARVAELVVSLEDKLDDMEFQLFDNVRVIADNMLKIVNIQDSFRSGLDDIRSSFDNLEERLKSLGERTGLVTGEGGGATAPALNTSAGPDKGENLQPWNLISDQLESLTLSVQRLSNLDLDKAFNKMDALEKKVDALGKELKPARKRTKADSTAETPKKDSAGEQN